MKLAWLCYGYYSDEDGEWDKEASIRFDEPSRYTYKRVVPIVYSEIEDHE